MRWPSGEPLEIMAGLRSWAESQGYTDQWLLVAQDLVQRSSRIALHRGLWKPIGVDPASFKPEDIAEWKVDVGEGHRFFGAIRADRSIDHEVWSILTSNANSWIALCSQRMESGKVQEMLLGGWGGVSLLPHAALLKTAKENAWLLIRCVDYEMTAASVVAIHTR